MQNKYQKQPSPLSYVSVMHWHIKTRDFFCADWNNSK